MTATKERKRKGAWRYLGDNLHKWMIFPAFVLFLTFVLIPLVFSFGLSFTSWNGIGQASFVGLANFAAFFSDERAGNAVKNSVVFAVCSVPLLNILGLGYAMLLDKGRHFNQVVKAIVYIPAVISPLIMGYIWLLVLKDNYGVLYTIFNLFGQGSSYQNLLGNKDLALVVIILVNTFQYVGLTMTIYSAGLQAIPTDLYESASVDGASWGQKFLHITLPMLGPSILINVITNIIGSLGIFDLVVSLTNGGPGYHTETLSLYIYRLAYGARSGYASALAVIMFFLILFPVLIAYAIMRKSNLYLSEDDR
jgi:raffinose/stachyose/melibiose transport system permease protein